MLPGKIVRDHDTMRKSIGKSNRHSQRSSPPPALGTRGVLRTDEGSREQSSTEGDEKEGSCQIHNLFRLPLHLCEKLYGQNSKKPEATFWLCLPLSQRPTCSRRASCPPGRSKNCWFTSFSG